MNKFISHAIAGIASVVVVAIVATIEQKAVGYATLTSFLVGKFGYDAAQKLLEKKVK